MWKSRLGMNELLKSRINRHFLKEELPRIRYANPTIDIHVEKVNKTKEEKWKSEIELEFSAL